MDLWPKLITLLTLLGLCAPPVFSQPTAGFTIAMLAKNTADPNFIDAWEGCQQALRNSPHRCLLIGPKGSANPREQIAALDQALKSHDLDALAVSVTHSGLLYRHLKLLDIPIISFDSPFDQQHQDAGIQYIGVNNYVLGRKLAALAKQSKPSGGTVCLMTAANDQNLNQRLQGVRQEFSGNPDWPMNTKLQGQGSWYETSRCPWDSGDSSARSLRQLKSTLTGIKPDVFISVGHWPTMDYEAILKLFSTSGIKQRKDKTRIFIASGKLSTDQLSLLDEKIIDGYVTFGFFDIGVAVAGQLIRTLSNQSIENNSEIRITTVTHSP